MNITSDNNQVEQINTNILHSYMKKTILLIFDGKMSFLPPFQTIINCLLDKGEYDIKVVSTEEETETDSMYEQKGIVINHCYKRYYFSDPIRKNIFRIIKEIKIYKGINNYINRIPHDILWIIHEKTAIKIRPLLKNRPFILSIYELRDDEKKLLKKLSRVANQATVNVVCEYNRAQIQRSWFNLDEMPIVFPNKPFNHPRKRGAESPLVIKQGIKYVLYQGIITENRNLEILSEAISGMDGFKLVLMGGKTQYLNRLLEKYPSIIYINHIKAPNHLKVTSNAYIGVVSYGYKCLNTLYCAPNKIWEYSGFGIPMLANDVPGLKYTVENNQTGVCVDMNSVDNIRKAIKVIDNNYELYSKNASAFYDTCDVSAIVEDILRKFETSKSSK